ERLVAFSRYAIEAARTAHRAEIFPHRLAPHRGRSVRFGHRNAAEAAVPTSEAATRPGNHDPQSRAATPAPESGSRTRWVGAPVVSRRLPPGGRYHLHAHREW